MNENGQGPEFYPWRFVMFYDDVVQYCDFFGVDDDFNLEIPALCDPMLSYAEGSLESMPDYA